MKRSKSLFDGRTPAVTPNFVEAPPATDQVAAKLYRMLRQSQRENAELRRALERERGRLQQWKVRGMMKRLYTLKVGPKNA